MPSILWLIVLLVFVVGGSTGYCGRKVVVQSRTSLLPGKQDISKCYEKTAAEGEVAPRKFYLWWSYSDEFDSLLDVRKGSKESQS